MLLTPKLTVCIGDLKPDWDSDIWADHDEDCRGRIEDQKDDFPEGFVWDCCNRHGDEQGCRIGTHVDDERYAKRGRF